MNNPIANIDYSPGQIAYFDFPINMGAELSQQITLLDEDLIQVKYPNQLILDVGWYPSFSKHGSFQIRIVYREDWDSPIYYAESKSLSELYTQILAAVGFCKEYQ